MIYVYYYYGILARFLCHHINSAYIGIQVFGIREFTTERGYALYEGGGGEGRGA